MKQTADYGNNQEYIFNDEKKKKAAINAKSSAFLSKVFGYLSIFVLITAIVAAGLGLLMSYLWGKAINSGNDALLERTTVGFFIAMVISAVGVFVLSMIINIKGISGKSVLPFAIPYSILMGVLLSTFVMFIDWYYLVLAFLITALSFAFIYLIGKVVKVNISVVILIASSMFFGALILSFSFFIFYIIAPALFNWIYVGITAIIYVAVFLFIAVDIWQIQRIAEAGENSNNLAMFCGFRLYVDFIYLFIRILLLILRFAKKN